ncbi:MAG: DUF4492 domain-containing protein [Clostridium sp.]|nr:DUF4492 domain-containing protein [Clostridium sp.]
MESKMRAERDMPGRVWQLPGKVWRFYADGFRSMTVGRKLWALILFKLIVLFLVLKLFFFPDLLQRDYGSDAERSEAVRQALTKQAGEGENEIETTLKQ